MIFLKTQELSEDSEHNVRKQKEFFHLHIKLQLNVKLYVKEKITTLISQELNSKNSVWISSENVFHQQKMYLKMLNLEKVKSMKSYLSEDLLEFQKFNNFFKNSSMEKLLTNQSTQMKQSLMELLFKLPFLLDKVTKKLKSFYFLMLPHFLLELKQLEVS